MKGFQHSFDLDPDSSSYANLSGNIVSVLQGGCFFGAAASFWLSDKMLVLCLARNKTRKAHKDVR